MQSLVGGEGESHAPILPHPLAFPLPSPAEPLPTQLPTFLVFPLAASNFTHSFAPFFPVPFLYQCSLFPFPSLPSLSPIFCFPPSSDSLPLMEIWNPSKPPKGHQDVTTPSHNTSVALSLKIRYCFISFYKVKLPPPQPVVQYPPPSVPCLQGCLFNLLGSRGDSSYFSPLPRRGSCSSIGSGSSCSSLFT